MPGSRFDVLSFVALFLIFFMGFKLIAQSSTARAETVLEITAGLSHIEQASEPVNASGGTVMDQPTENIGVQDIEPERRKLHAIIAPYEEYVITQGPHGYSYGHLAIDLSAGRGAKIISPIDGQITERYIDEYGNTTLVIENNKFRITLLHGEYTVDQWEWVYQGDVLGRESNRGYTMDMQGNLCHGRSNCGNHTHINIFDKRINQNVNPLDVMNR
jgi:murein DD-endopeptidase MepM/ murein hydrolase activator NlpD